MRLTTFNVNGLRSFVRRLERISSNQSNSISLPVINFLGDFLDSLKAEIICFQETKINSKQSLDNKLTHPSLNYESVFSFNSSKTKIGYSGVAVYYSIKRRPSFIQTGFTWKYSSGTLFKHYESYLNCLDEEYCEKFDLTLTKLRLLDSEGRCIILDFDDFFLFNLYLPLSANDERSQFKYQYELCIRHLCETLLDKIGKPIILAGDFNSTYDPRDHCDYIEAYRKEGPSSRILQTEFYSSPFRKWLRDLVSPDSINPLFIDTLRYKDPDISECYTCWNQKINARVSNYGTRIDYILVDKKTLSIWNDSHDSLKGSFFLPSLRSDIHGSDHCPYQCDFDPALFPSFSIINGNGTITSESDNIIGNNLPYPSHVSSNPSEAEESESLKNKPVTLKKFFSSSCNDNKDMSFHPAMDSQSVDIMSSHPKKKRKSQAGAPTLDTFFKKEAQSNKNRTDEDADIERRTETSMAESICPPHSFRDLLDHTNDVNEEFLPDNQTKVADSENDRGLSLPASAAATDGQMTESWKKIFENRKKIPLCSGHHEPCKLYVTSKKGKNQGRQFFLCSRPPGPSSQPESRCSFFQWYK